MNARVLRGFIVALLCMPAPAFACRCAEQPLSQYFAAADHVAIGIVTKSAPAAAVDDIELTVTLVDAPYKGAGFSGDSATYRTASSSAGCGVSSSTGDVLVLFGFGTGTDQLRIDSCSGTRTLRTATASSDRGFMDVPAQFVVGQLTALAGLDALHERAAHPVDVNDPAGTALIGLLDIEPFAHGGTISVYGAPADATTTLVNATDIEAFYHREAGYEFAAAEVYARNDSGYKVRLKDDRFGWVRAADAGTFFSYAELPVKRLAYLTAAWDGFIWPDPGAGLPSRVAAALGPARPAEIPANVLRSMTIGDTLWFYVEVLTASPCAGDQARIDYAGWVPAYAAAQTPTVWYYSRGC